MLSLTTGNIQGLTVYIYVCISFIWCCLSNNNSCSINVYRFRAFWLDKSTVTCLFLIRSYLDELFLFLIRSYHDELLFYYQYKQYGGRRQETSIVSDWKQAWKPVYSDVYSYCDCIGTVYTCMNSWKEVKSDIKIQLLFCNTSHGECLTHIIQHECNS